MPSPRADTRAAQVDAQLRSQVAVLEADFYTLCDLVIEARDGEYYTRFGFLGLEDYLVDRLGLSARSVLKRLAPAEACLALPPAVQARVRAELCEVGSSKAAILAPALRKDPDGALDWLQHAAAETVEALQARVSTALGLKPRGPAKPGDRFLRMVLNQMPTEARDEVAEAFALGQRVHGIDNSVGVQIAMAREAVAAWSPADAQSAAAADLTPSGQPCHRHCYSDPVLHGVDSRCGCPCHESEGRA